ncbi:MAG: Bax protein [Alphaproteobacteria bacterium]|nr:Bax protein [Alphaproteobacteria bacterium]
MSITKRILAGAAGTVVSLSGMAVALAYVLAMLSTVPSLGRLAMLSGPSSSVKDNAAPTLWDRIALGSGQIFTNASHSVDGVLMVAPQDRQQLQSHFAALDYSLPQAGDQDAGDKTVPRLYLRRLPHDLAVGDSTWERKRDFIRVMLPLVLAGNEKIMADRQRVEKFARQVQGGGNLYAVNKSWVISLAAEYGLDDFDPKDGDWQELLRRVDTVPVSLALAQAALESGWGTSRFAQQGNAVFGQVSWRPGSGLIQTGRDPDANYEVRSFSTLSDCVNAYLHNLNTHRHYAKFRNQRANVQERGQVPSGVELIKYLDRYSVLGKKYIDEIRGIIETNLLQEMDAAKLRPANSAALTSS